MIRVLLVTGLFIIGCQTQSKGEAPASATKAKALAPAGSPKAPASTTKTKVAAPAPKTIKSTVKGITKGRAKQVARTAKKKIKWQDSLTWRTWDEAQHESATTGKPIMLLIYAHWCPRCRDLAPIFRDPKVVANAKGLVLVRQDQDERPDWLSQYREFGGYVPRIIFFGPDGQPRKDITSSRGRYPYFYTPRSVAALVRSMKTAAGK